MVEFCGEGPPAARVDDVSVEYGDPEGATGFEVRR
jgi:acylphosphatase